MQDCIILNKTVNDKNVTINVISSDKNKVSSNKKNTPSILNKEKPINNSKKDSDFSQNFEKHDGLNCLFTNTDTLTNKLTELQNFCSENKIDIIAICESLPKNNNFDKQDIKFVLEGYASLQNNTGRGVVIFYKETLTISEIPCSLPSAIFCKIKTNKKQHFTFGLVYR